MPAWIHQLEHGLFTDSRNMKGPVGLALRMLRYPAALIRDWLSGELNMRAMSLVYTTLLSLVPLIAFSFSVLKGLGAHSDLRLFVFEFFRPMGAAAGELTARVMQFVENTRGGVLGSIGLAFLIYTVIGMIQKVEASLNFVWRVDRPRSLGRRLSEYLSVMIIGPIFMVAAIGLLAAAQNTTVALWIGQWQPLGSAFTLLASLGPYFLVTIVFTFLYSFIPNTRVKLLPALVGGVTGGALWALVGKIFTAFIAYSTQMVAIYTGFAIVLTTLIWLYLNWLIFLIGAQLSFYAQNPQYLRHGHEPVELTGSIRERIALSVMYLIGRDYARGKAAWSTNELAVELDVPSVALASVISSLEHNALLIASEKESLLPARDMQSIRLIEIWDSVRCTPPGRIQVAARAAAAASEVMEHIDAAIRSSIGEKTLKDLIASG